MVGSWLLETWNFNRFSQLGLGWRPYSTEYSILQEKIVFRIWNSLCDIPFWIFVNLTRWHYKFVCQWWFCGDIGLPFFWRRLESLYVVIHVSRQQLFIETLVFRGYAKVYTGLTVIDFFYKCRSCNSFKLDHY